MKLSKYRMLPIVACLTLPAEILMMVDELLRRYIFKAKVRMFDCLFFPALLLYRRPPGELIGEGFVMWSFNRRWCFHYFDHLIISAVGVYHIKGHRGFSQSYII